jgi:hypothetical protein
MKKQNLSKNALPVTVTRHTDSMGGLLEVSIFTIKALNIQDEISENSFRRENMVYLDEAEDGQNFIEAWHRAMKDQGAKGTLDYRDVYDGFVSPIRSYKCYQA